MKQLPLFDPNQPSAYELKQAAKKERLRGRAQSAAAKAQAACATAEQIMNAIPMGQPILVGHHSERRHRRDLARLKRASQTAYEQGEKAKALSRRAEQDSDQISSDDPKAIEKITARIGRLEQRRNQYKEDNKRLRKEGKKDRVHPGYTFSNLSAEIRRLKKRIEQLKKAQLRPEAAPEVHEDFSIEECKADNRLRIIFKDRPAKEICKQLRSLGFVFARSAGAWQRRLDNMSLHRAEQFKARYLEHKASLKLEQEDT